MSGRSDRGQRVADWLEDILANIARIESHIANLTEADFSRDDLRHDAVKRCIERICEVAARLGDTASELMPGQPWPDIQGVGNWLRHAYDHVDAGIVWQVVAHRLSGLKRDTSAALATLRQQDNTAP